MGQFFEEIKKKIWKKNQNKVALTEDICRGNNMRQSLSQRQQSMFLNGGKH